MKTSEKIASLIVHGTVGEAKALAHELIKGGQKLVAIDLYRCIVGNDRTLTKHLDHDMLSRLAALVEQAEDAGASYAARLLGDEAVVAFAHGRGPLPERLPMPPVTRY